MTKTKTLPPQTLQQIPAAVAPRPTKAAQLRARLAEPGGASMTELMLLTVWQAHTLRAALTGLRKTGLSIIRNSEGGETIYSISSANPVLAPDGGIGKGAEAAVASPGIDANVTVVPPVAACGLPDAAISEPGKGVA